MERSALVHQRTARACERCRHKRRRCKPPYPCQSCVAANVTCDVRTQARPQRQQQRRYQKTSSPPQLREQGTKSDAGQTLGSVLDRNDDIQRTFSSEWTCDASHVSRRAQDDAFETLRTLVQAMLSRRYGAAQMTSFQCLSLTAVGYTMDCAMIEPALCGSEARSNSSDGSELSATLTLTQAWDLLVKFQKFMSWQDANLVDLVKLHNTACTIIESSSTLSTSAVIMTATVSHSPLDSVALVFAALALGAVAGGDIVNGRLYFDISIEVTKHFIGKSTLDLCLADFLQHVFALRVGTSNYAQNIISQAIQHAHDLGLHRNSRGIQGLQLYLLIYMADQ